MQRSLAIEYELEPDIARWQEAKAVLRKSPQAGFEMMLQLAERGSLLATYEVGRALVNGVGAPKNHVEAEKWFRRLAEKKSVRGNYWLGRLLLLDKRFQEAAEAFRFSAARGFAPALLYLGKIYYNGWGVDRDIDRARRYLEQASQAGSVFATRLLATTLMRERPSLSMRFYAAKLIIRAFAQLVTVVVRDGVSSERLIR